MRLQFPILRLLIVVLIAALMLAAWRFANRISANLTLNATVFVLAAYDFAGAHLGGRGFRPVLCVGWPLLTGMSAVQGLS